MPIDSALTSSNEGGGLGRFPPLITPRLSIEAFGLGDAGFLLSLLNDPGFLAHIGDRGVRSLAEAEAYLQTGLFHGLSQGHWGLRKVVLRSSGLAVGMCGLLQRQHLPGPDLGYAFLSAHAGQGLASEAARAVLELAWVHHGLSRVLAIVKPGNSRSIKLLSGLGFGLLGDAPQPPGPASGPLGPAAPLGLYAVTRPLRPPAAP